MVCPYCNSKTSVENSRTQKRSNQVWRRRACKACKAVFTTHEAIDLSSALLVQKSASLEPFVQDRLFASILECMPHRVDKYLAARETSQGVVIKLTTLQSAATVSTVQIAELTAKKLKVLDKKAYLHYTANHL